MKNLFKFDFGGIAYRLLQKIPKIIRTVATSKFWMGY